MNALCIFCLHGDFSFFASLFHLIHSLNLIEMCNVSYHILRYFDCWSFFFSLQRSHLLNQTAVLVMNACDALNCYDGASSSAFLFYHDLSLCVLLLQPDSITRQ